MALLLAFGYEGSTKVLQSSAIQISMHRSMHRDAAGSTSRWVDNVFAERHEVYFGTTEMRQAA